MSVAGTTLPVDDCAMMIGDGREADIMPPCRSIPRKLPDDVEL